MKQTAALIISLFLFLSVTSPVYSQATGSMYFDQTSVDIQNGSEFNSKIIIDTFGTEAGGAGAKINFNPTLLEVVSVNPGIIFDDYPLAAFDNSAGTVFLSGVASAGSLYSGKGELGSISWRAKKTGTTQISFDFVPGSTTDSNIAVTFGNGDILSETSSLNVNILPGSGTSASASPTPEGVASKTPSIIDRAISVISNLINPKPAIDPYEPLARLDPKTSLGEDEDQQNTSFVAKTRKVAEDNPVVLAALLISSVVLIIILLVKLLRKRRKSETTVINEPPPQTPI